MSLVTVDETSEIDYASTLSNPGNLSSKLIMEKWILTSAILMLLKTITSMEDGACSCGKSAVGGEQVTCQNVTPSFFQNVQLNLSRAHWFTCDNCVLSSITENTFNFSRNNISFLILNHTRIHQLGNFAFTKLPLLKVLNLSDNLIDTIDYKAFSGMKRLLQLDLSRNGLKILKSGIFMELQNLDILNLNHNHIGLIEENAFAGLNNLQYLYLSNNKLKYLQEDCFKHAVRLKILNLNNNLLEEFHSYAFNNLRSLNHLYLNNNSINFLVQYSFKELTSLLELQLRKNNLSEIQTSAFNGLRNIKYLYLSENSLVRIKPYGFVGLNSLLILDLIGNKFVNFSLDYLNGMEYLTSVWLQNNSITNFTISKQADTLEGLRVLDLLDNRLDYINFKYMHTKLPKLQQLYVGNNFWNCQIALQMFEYFQGENISLCLDYGCKIEKTELYVQDLCKNITDENEDYNLDQDFVADASAFVKFDLYLVLILFAMLFLNVR